MADYERIAKDDLLANIQQGGDDLMGFIMTLTPEAVLIPTDAAGWTGADHLMHLAVWLNGVNVLLDGGNRYEAMGLDRDLFMSDAYDAMNAVIQQQHRGASLPEVRAALEGAHNRIVEHVKAMTDEDLYRPYHFYAPDMPTWTSPVINTIVGDTYNHYREHMAWIKAITDGYRVSKGDILRQIQDGWAQINALLDSYTPEQMTQPTDAAGWTVKDHVIHMAAWADGVIALLNKQNRHEAMGVDAEIWNRHEIDAINDAIYQRNKDLSLEEVRARFQAVHERLVTKIESMTTDDLHLPYSAYQMNADDVQRPVYLWIGGNSYGHYEEHTPWIKAIAESTL